MWMPNFTIVKNESYYRCLKKRISYLFKLKRKSGFQSLFFLCRFPTQTQRKVWILLQQEDINFGKKMQNKNQKVKKVAPTLFDKTSI